MGVALDDRGLRDGYIGKACIQMKNLISLSSQALCGQAVEKYLWGELGKSTAMPPCLVEKYFLLGIPDIPS